jgi:hypothetical protein
MNYISQVADIEPSAMDAHAKWVSLAYVVDNRPVFPADHEDFDSPVFI